MLSISIRRFRIMCINLYLTSSYWCWRHAMRFYVHKEAVRISRCLWKNKNATPPRGILTPEEWKLMNTCYSTPGNSCSQIRDTYEKKDTSLTSLFLLQRMKTNEHMRSYPWEFGIPESANSMENCHPHPFRVLTPVEWKVMNTNTLPRGVSYSRLRQINETWYATT